MSWPSIWKDIYHTKFAVHELINVTQMASSISTLVTSVTQQGE